MSTFGNPLEPNIAFSIGITIGINTPLVFLLFSSGARGAAELSAEAEFYVSERKLYLMSIHNTPGVVRFSDRVDG